MAETQASDHEDEIETKSGSSQGLNAWSVKGVSLERRGAILRAAKARRETLGEYLWGCHECRIGADQWPVPRASDPIAGIAERPADGHGHPEVSKLSLVELFDVICRLATAESTIHKRSLFSRRPPDATTALLGEARALLEERLRELRGTASHPAPQPPLPVLPGHDLTNGD